ncbi:hypothetical protein KUTeg_018886 [Tegillarca granosa]|uniref:Sugar phosphate transporter domain-containing protein n=1 Tax=Tegillarca granosa TaxID=220873 RepID=A0ABQ9EGD7_TEGGR|nr:hypothetical protein KUTeg_018886 [Tegillarca granosa]
MKKSDIKSKKKKKPKLKKLENVLEPKAEIVKQSVCSVPFFTLAVKTFCLIIFYYTFSISLTFYNQRFIHHFKLPLSLTMAHLVVKFILAGTFRMLLECKNKEERITLQWGMYIKKVFPTGLASILDIALSNWSFEFITVSLYTMTKSTAVIFILLFSIIFRLEKARCSLVFVVIFISSGLFMFTYHSTQFNLEGFLMVLSASILSGVRWTLAQIVTQRNEIGLHNPLDMIFEDYGILMRNMGLVFGGALLAFFLEFSEFLLLANTSSLTLSIAGIFKEVCTLYLAAKVNGDTMNFINGIGLVMCLCGISLHVILKAVYSRSEKLSTVAREDGMEMLLQDGEPNNKEEEDTEEETDIFNVFTTGI